MTRSLLAAIAASSLALAGAPAAGGAHETFGHSAHGRPLKLEWVGDRHAKRVVLVVGSIHGNETAGHAVIRRLRRARPPAGTAIALVEDMNPDGSAANTRQNGRGVDLNRNFPVAWRGGGRPYGTYYPGRAPLTEPESRAAERLIRRLRPAVTIWYHQHMGLVDRSGGDPAIERLYARRCGLPFRRLAPLAGTATRWQNHTFPGDTAFVVELRAGRLTRAGAARHAAAVLAVAGAG
ncbi:MAG: murein peptide amidase [Thermoleophilaceae bacterium]|nr:murein peptide amidase [Thermoleophilaceae bacterium]